VSEKLTAEEAEVVLKGILDREERRYRTIMSPYYDALFEIDLRKPPRPVQMPDGTFMVYKGPTAENIAGPYKAPTWLARMCEVCGGEEWRDLARFRDRNKP
jgi:hypothetical protein